MKEKEAISNIHRIIELFEFFRKSKKDDDLKVNICKQILLQAEVILKNKRDKSDQEHKIKEEYVSVLHYFLNNSYKTDFLVNLKKEERYRWAEIACRIIRESNYTLKDMFDNRVAEKPEHVLFYDCSDSKHSKWTYEMINHKVREFATVFHTVSEDKPRLAIISENNVSSACCDLACLMYDIPNTPLNIHFDSEEIISIINSLGINIVVVDTELRFNRLIKIREKLASKFNIFVLDEKIKSDEKSVFFLDKYCKKFGKKQFEEILSNRQLKSLDDVASIMFTSGSTGKPKGVSFTYYNLISKRFSRAAALPKVGNNEVLLCFLPLYHTFGRFLEMLGTIFWGGTYVFTRNSSAETLLSLFPKINPTGFISIPLRWSQLKERCEESMQNYTTEKATKRAFRNIVGSRLRWGLSAAGYLEPNTFTFFERNGVDLCSGFGMTEATGGITMTEPGKYIKHSVGQPLPCIKTRLSENNELEISGDFVAGYFSDKNNASSDSWAKVEFSSERWFSTGDIFRKDKGGNFYIVDRLKDIYKNNKGQTISPKKVEDKFKNVPGIKRTFLVGDGREYNVLFIVPDYKDPIMSLKDIEIRDYFHRIVNAVNEQLAIYERVVNFTVLDRDFNQDELTSKGSYKRKKIAVGFSKEIADLYRSDYIALNIDEITILIPRWIYRNLGILEYDITISGNTLFNKHNDKSLLLRKVNTERYQIGDLEYVISNSTIDFSILIRQPYLWVGNPSLIKFYPCIDRWDLNTKNISRQVFLPKSDIHWHKSSEKAMQAEKLKKTYNFSQINKELKNIKEHNLIEINKLICETMFSGKRTALVSLKKISELFEDSDMRIKEIFRRRLEALANHPDESVRCLAYRILLLEEPNPDYSKSFPAFVESGLTFLNKESIKIIALSKLGKRRLESLRQRMFSYRSQLSWPGTEERVKQFSGILRLLVDFAKFEPQFYSSVRAELASWIIHFSCPALSEISIGLFKELYENYESNLIKANSVYNQCFWKQKMIFEDNFSKEEINDLNKILVGTVFLEESVILAFDEYGFSLVDIVPKGIWITKLEFENSYRKYRISINTINGKHFDLLVTLYSSQEIGKALKTSYWYAAVSGFPFYPRVLTRLGCCRPELGAVSAAYNSDLTAWEKIRELSGSRTWVNGRTQNSIWRKLFIRAFVAFFRGWRNSGYRIVPGPLTPTNVVVPELDFHEGAYILSLSGFTEYTNCLSLVKPIIFNFYYKTIAHYPWCSNELVITWIFDSYIEALGKESACKFLNTLLVELEDKDIQFPEGTNVKDILSNYLQNQFKNYYVPLSLLNAVDRYKNWELINSHATIHAKEDTITELYRLYHLYEHQEIARYYFYRLTYFANSKKRIRLVYDKLLSRMEKEINVPATQMIELSELQNEISDNEERELFSRIVFPSYDRRNKIDLVKAEGGIDQKLLLSTHFEDRFKSVYTIRKPLDPSEIGQLYRLFYLENYPKTISEDDEYYLAIDSQERIIGGICYIQKENEEILLDGTVVVSTLKGRGIGTKMVTDFCNRMEGKGKKVIKTHFYLQEFYKKIGFKVDKRWGALVKILDENFE
jgi:long-chain acyl-CoA synthetase